VAACASCDRVLPLKDGLCRLCWRQSERSHAPRERIDRLEACRHGQQLFFADMHRAAGGIRTTRPSAAVEPAVKVRRDRRQLRLFDPDRPIPHPHRQLLLELVAERAAAFGWNPGTAKRVRRAVGKVLADLPLGQPASATQTAAMLNAANLPASHTLALLAHVGLLDEDRTPALVAWFDRQIVGLPDPMAHELRLWFTVLHEGHTTPPRTRPRSPVTIKTRLGWVLPTLHHWADAGHSSLREITRADVAAALPASGTPRATLGLALRSIFSTLKAHKVVFTNPIARTDIGEIERRQPLPTDLEPIRDALHPANPARAAIAALVAFHGLRTIELRGLHLTDIHDRRLHLDGRTVLLADPVAVRVTAWLDHRTARWPNTANPHLFITSRSALGTTPVGGNWIWKTLGMSPQRLRQHRILDEALATGGDVRRITDLFDVTVGTAIRYADIAVDHPDLSH
jgi:hypothetical protein